MNAVKTIVGLMLMLTWFGALGYACIDLATEWYEWVVIGAWTLASAYTLWQMISEFTEMADVFESMFEAEMGVPYEDVEGTIPWTPDSENPPVRVDPRG